MSGDPREERMMEAARRVNTPPETPREVMWRRIEEKRRPPLVLRPRWRRPSFWAWGSVGATAAAAVLALGIWIGRAQEALPGAADPMLTEGIEASSPGGQGSPRRDSGAGYRVATSQLFERSETFLTRFRAEASEPQTADVSNWARGLLAESRLLMDSPAGDDVEVRILLQDLELVLARIAAVPETQTLEARAHIATGLDEGTVMARLRARTPGDRNPSGT